MANDVGAGSSEANAVTDRAGVGGSLRLTGLARGIALSRLDTALHDS